MVEAALSIVTISSSRLQGVVHIFSFHTPTRRRAEASVDGGYLRELLKRVQRNWFRVLSDGLGPLIIPFVNFNSVLNKQGSLILISG